MKATKKTTEPCGCTSTIYAWKFCATHQAVEDALHASWHADHVAAMAALDSRKEWDGTASHARVLNAEVRS